MSLFSFIAFPKKVDRSCLKSMIDKSKMVKVKDLKGTKWEKDYMALPDELEVYLGNADDLREFQLYEKHPAVSFKEVFNNRFIYSMNAEFKKPKTEIPNTSIEEILDEIEKQDGVRMSKEEYIKHSEEYVSVLQQENIRYVARCRKQLYDLVKHNTDSDETVEIFCGWIGTSAFVELGPPKEKRELKLEEVLTSELLDMQDKLKIEIRNIK